MDNNSDKKPWNTEDFSKNYYMPEQFESSVYEALKVSDEYVWIYTEQPRWWTEKGQSVKLPAAYETAIRNAQSDFQKSNHQK